MLVDGLEGSACNLVCMKGCSVGVDVRHGPKTDVRGKGLACSRVFATALSSRLSRRFIQWEWHG